MESKIVKNSVIGSNHWFNTIIGKYKRISELLSKRNFNTQNLNEWGKYIKQSSEELLGWKNFPFYVKDKETDYREISQEPTLYGVYKRALELHKESYQQVAKINKRKWWQKRIKFDDSHLPKGYDDMDKWDAINDKLSNSIKPENLLSNGNFKCYLSFDEALILLIKPNFDNIHYQTTWIIDLQNYEFTANTFTIFVK